MTNKSAMPSSVMHQQALPSLAAGNLSTALPTAATTAPVTGPTQKLENSTMRISSKTKVSTGNRRNTISKLGLL